jgi:hypothetical protein
MHSSHHGWFRRLHSFFFGVKIAQLGGVQKPGWLMISSGIHIYIYIYYIILYYIMLYYIILYYIILYYIILYYIILYYIILYYIL